MGKKKAHKKDNVKETSLKHMQQENIQDKKVNKPEKAKKAKRKKTLLWVLLFQFVVIVGLISSYYAVSYLRGDLQDIPTTNDGAGVVVGEERRSKGPSKKELEILKEQELLRKEEQERQELIEQADRLALGYDYDAAISLIQTYVGNEGGYHVYKNLLDAIQKYNEMRASLVLYGGVYNHVSQINHIFFHSLIVDPSKAFDGDYKTTGYNMYMTTVSEFEKMIQKLYDDGYVLVNMSDIAEQVTLEDGTTKFVESKLYLPRGKKPLVLSQDDVNYYEYMIGDGFASRLVVDEDGKPTTEMILEDGTVVTGPFDIVPIIDDFVEKHPDFSYRGAKGILAITGYEGVFGYRTNDPNSPTYEEDKEAVRAVAQALRDNGWEIASHSWGHRNSYDISTALFQRDTERWAEEVGSLIGPTDIYIYPFGVEVESGIGTYKGDKYKILKNAGFNYFLGVNKDPWMQIRDDYVRMSRRPLDGQAMLQFPERLADLFNVEEIIDPSRPERDW